MSPEYIPLIFAVLLVLVPLGEAWSYLQEPLR